MTQPLDRGHDHQRRLRRWERRQLEGGGARRELADTHRDRHGRTLRHTTRSQPTVAVHPRTAPGTDLFDVKGLVQQWADGQPNNGLLLKQTTEDPAAPSLVSYYSDDSPTSTLRPVLDVRWSDPSKDVGKVTSIDAASPLPGSTVSTLERPLTLSAEASAARGGATVAFKIDGQPVGTRRHRAVHRGVGHRVGRLDPAHADHRGDDVAPASPSRPRRRSPWTTRRRPTNVTITEPAASATVSGSVLVKATASRRPLRREGGAVGRRLRRRHQERRSLGPDLEHPRPAQPGLQRPARPQGRGGRQQRPVDRVGRCAASR